MSNENSNILRREHSHGVTTLTLHRPDRLNALNGPLLDALYQTVQEIDGDPQTRVMVLTGAGEKAFCVGADLKERQTMSEEDVAQRIRTYRKLFDTIAALSKPTICAINGFAFGGGLEIALAFDLRFAAAHAKMGLTELRLGIIPGAGGTQRLTRLVGPSRAKELIFSAARLSAHEACALGIVNRVVEGALREATQEFAETLCLSAPIALTQAKRAIDQGIDSTLEEGLDIEERCYAVTIPTNDRLEGLRAFAEKRPPEWTGQ